jgi:hypothetical protein
MNQLEKIDLISQIREILADQDSTKEFYCEGEVTVNLELTFRIEEFSTMIDVPTAKLVDLSHDDHLRLVVEGGGSVDVDEIHQELETELERKIANMDGDDFVTLAQRNGDILVTDYTLDGITDVCDADGEELT